MSITLNPSDKGANVTLSNGNLTTTSTALQSVKATTGISSGKYYFETKVITVGTSGLVGVTLASVNNATASTSWADTDGIGLRQDGNIEPVNSTLASITFTTGDFIGCAIDADNKIIYWYKNNTLLGSRTLPTGTVYPTLQINGGSYTVNFGTTLYSGYIPYGFSSYDTPGVTHRKESRDLSSINKGDVVRSEYMAASGLIGSFSNMMNTSKNDIPIVPAAVADGAFNLLYTGKDTGDRLRFIADRNLQHTISWDVINTAGIASGSGIIVTEDNSIKIVEKGGSATINVAGNVVTGAASSGVRASYGVITGKWYWEVKLTTLSSTYQHIGIGSSACSLTTAPGLAASTGGLSIYACAAGVDNSNSGKVYSNNSVIDTSAAAVTFATDDVIGIMLDMDNKKITILRNNVVIVDQANIPSALQSIKVYPMAGATTGAGGATTTFYFGSTGFTYSVPTGYKAFSGSLIWPAKNFWAYTIKLPTGGVSSGDIDNDWDKLVATSTLNNTITAGDSQVWNFSTTSWCSTTPSTIANRVVRGGATVSTYSSIASGTANSSQGFRPVILVEIIDQIKYLLRDGDNIRALINGSWTMLGIYPISGADLNTIFQASGMTDFNLLTNTALMALTSDTPQLLTYNSDLNCAGNTIKVTAVPPPQLVLASGDLDLTYCSGIDSVTLLSTVSTSATLRLIVSIDGGGTWKTYNNGTSTWDTISINPISNVKDNGMTPTLLNALNRTNWNALVIGDNMQIGTSQIRFGYYMEITDPTDNCLTSDISLVVDFLGSWEMAIPGDDYVYSYPKNNTIRVKLFASGSYKINY